MIKIASVSLAKLSQVVFSGFKVTAKEIEMLLEAEYWLLSKAEKNNKQTNESRFKIFFSYIIKWFFSLSVYRFKFALYLSVTKGNFLEDLNVRS